jgi:general secretion pathway protein D
MSRLPLILLLLACSALLGGCAAANFYREGNALIDRGQYEQGVEMLRNAAERAPTRPLYRATYLRRRDDIFTTFMDGVEQALRDQRFDDAQVLIERAGKVDSQDPRVAAAGRELERGRRMAEAIRTAEAEAAAGRWEEADAIVRRVQQQEPRHRAAGVLRQRLDAQRVAQRTTAPTLKSRLPNPVTLQFRETPLRAALEALSRDTDINFVFDREVRADTRITAFLRRVRVEEAIDLMLIPVQLEKKVLSENTVLVYPATQAKQREYQELVMRSFYIETADLKQTQALLKTMLKLRDVSIDERINLIVVRDTPEVVRLAERLIATLDVPEPEVMLDVEVLEIARSSETNIGAKYADSLTLKDRVFVNQLDSSITLNLKSTSGRSNLLSNPRIRVTNRQKASVLIGERVPIISSITTPTTGGGQTVALVSQQINYVDIGLKLDVEPVVHLDDSISIRLGLEVNTLGERIETQTGSVAYRVGTRTTNTVLELRDGETQVLAGMIRDDDRRTVNGLPLLSQFPLLGRLFGAVSTEGTKTEIVLSITPRLIRTVRRADAADQEAWSGTDAVFRTRALQAQPQAGAPTPAAAAAPVGAVAPVPAPQSAPADAPPPNTAAVADADVFASWGAPVRLKAGETQVVSLDLRTQRALAGAIVKLEFDPAAVEILAVEGGDWLRYGFDQTVDPEGRISVGAAGPIPGGTTGAGSVARLTLRAKPGATAVVLRPLALTAMSATGQSVPVSVLAPLSLEVAP